jgi:hypothetical protein
MRTITETLYTFGELSDKAKLRAIEENRHINLNHDWWMEGEPLLDTEIFHSNRADVEFDLGAEAKIRFKGLKVKDSSQFFRWLGIPEKYWEQIGFEFFSFGNESSTRLSILSWDDPVEKELETALETAKTRFYIKTQDACKLLLDEYEDLTSDLCIADVLEGNAYEFYEDGTRYEGIK